MKLADARIGYGGYSRDFSVPGDRRRFAAYADLRSLPFELAELGRPYDLAYVTYSSDLPGWTARKRREGDRLKLVFELIDSYLTETGALRRHLKGSGRYLLGVDSRLSPDLGRTLIEACAAADAVVCSTEEQRATILRYNRNVFISFDYFGQELGSPKSDYSRGDRLRLVWEGQSTTLGNIQSIREPLNALRDKIELHVVSDRTTRRYFGRFGSFDSRNHLRGIECPIVFHPWERSSFAARVKAADVAIIPIDLTDDFARGKPENKLVMLWQLGLPVVASATPAYDRAMRAAGIALTCATPDDWNRTLESLVNSSPEELQQLGERGWDFADTAYSREQFIRRFDEVFDSLGLEP